MADGPPSDSAALIELVDADHRDHGIPDRLVPHDCANFHYPCPAIEPPSDSDCDDPECADGCSLTEFPVWMRPYRCRHVDDAGRRARRIVWGEPGDPIA